MQLLMGIVSNQYRRWDSFHHISLSAIFSQSVPYCPFLYAITTRMRWEELTPAVSWGCHESLFMPLTGNYIISTYNNTYSKGFYIKASSEANMLYIFVFSLTSPTCQSKCLRSFNWELTTLTTLWNVLIIITVQSAIPILILNRRLIWKLYNIACEAKRVGSWCHHHHHPCLLRCQLMEAIMHWIRRRFYCIRFRSYHCSPLTALNGCLAAWLPACLPWRWTDGRTVTATDESIQ